MKVIKPHYELLTEISEGGKKELKAIELAGRTCYKSEDKITEDSCIKFVEMLIKRGHEAMLEHGGDLTVKFTVDRGVSHELVRHRLASFAQESQRYCNYANDVETSNITFIEPCFFEKESEEYRIWYSQCKIVEAVYKQLIKNGCKPQEARTVLNNSVKTEIVIKANYREWRNILRLRTAFPAHPQMREVMIPLLKELKEKLPVLFDDIEVDAGKLKGRLS